MDTLLSQINLCYEQIRIISDDFCFVNDLSFEFTTQRISVAALHEFAANFATKYSKSKGNVL